MNFLRLFRSAAAFLLAAVLFSSTACASSTRSADVIAAALGEVGNAEGPNEYSKYGEWYGLPNSYWCDMFVSWCAMRGNVPADQFPRHCSCTDHVKRFVQMGRYQESMARGNNYIPQQGDVIFFYNNTRYPSGSVKNHTGLVLYVEDGYVYTIEGNALANRLDLPYDIVSEQRVDAMEPPDYVTVNRYPLDAPRIHGYGIPAYDDRTGLPLDGFVDLGRHAQSAAVFQSLCSAGVMEPTSAHTFSPNHGMTRAEFVQMTVDFFGLQGCAPETAAFADVPPESGAYAAVMAARSAGLLDGGEDNRFLPDRYITPQSAQTILNRALAYTGLAEQSFTFSLGDYSYIVSPYTIRADIAKAFDALCREMPLSAAFSGGVVLNGEARDWPVRLLDGVCCVPAAALREAFPDLELPGVPGEEPEAAARLKPEQAFDKEPEPAKCPVPMGNTDRVLPASVALRRGDAAADAAGFAYRGTLYVSLPAAAELLHLELAQEPDAVVLTAR